MKKHTPRVTPSPRHRWAPMALVLATLPMVIYADVPHTFEAKTVISSSQVNANFEDLDGRIGVYERAISVDGSGNVGVGTESPSSLLQISGRSDSAWNPDFLDDTSPELEIYNSSPIANSYAGIVLHVNGAGNARARIAALNAGSTDNSHLVFATEGGNTIREQMRITNSGNVGIGTSEPEVTLDVKGYMQTTADVLLNSVDPQIRVRTDSALRFMTNGLNERMRIASSGNVGIGTISPSQKLHVVGNVTADDYLYNSDRRLKRDILPLESALEQVQCLEGVSYRWEAPDASQDLQVGLIAQDVETCIPEVVTTDPTGYKSVSYARLVAPLIEAVKEQQHTISVLETRDSTQQQQITALEARLARLEALMQTRR